MRACLMPHGAEVHRSARRATASVRGLMRCGSVWECPVCSFKIARGRADEVRAAIAATEGGGGGVALMTLTFPHARLDRLADLVAMLSDAFTRFGKHRAWGAARSAAEVFGTIRALEVTWGQANGWHPHLHVLLFSESPWSADRLEAARAAAIGVWSSACLRAGLPQPSEKHGVDVRGGDQAARYVTKLGWGLDAEIALSSLKKGRGDRFTPWEILAQIAHTGNVAWRDRWREFAAAMKGSKQLQWSSGLRARLKVDEASDQVLADAGGSEDEALWATIAKPIWAQVFRLHRSTRGETIPSLLALAGAGDRDAFNSLLAGIQSHVIPSHRDVDAKQTST